MTDNPGFEGPALLHVEAEQCLTRAVSRRSASLMFGVVPNCRPQSRNPTLKFPTS
jgi:hypothetical protein